MMFCNAPDRQFNVCILTVCILICYDGMPTHILGQTGPHRIGTAHTLAYDARQVNPRYVMWHPVDGQEAALNPPRFRWPYDMATPRFTTELPAGRHLLFVHGGVIRVLTQDLGLDRFVPTGTLVGLDWSERRVLFVREPA